MSRRIEEMLEVVQQVHEKFENKTDKSSIADLRCQAAHSVASRRGIDYRTVQDTYRRQLEPDIRGVDDFDTLLENWLDRGSQELRDIILRHTIDSGDVADINSVFRSASEPDILVAHEFGYDPNDASFREGKVQFRLHLTRERDPSLVASAKKKWTREQGGQPTCSICEFSFTHTYGELGEGFIEAHHKEPISSLAPDTRVTVEDLVRVCSNCHSILHRRQPWPTVEELRATVSLQ